MLGPLLTRLDPGPAMVLLSGAPESMSGRGGREAARSRVDVCHTTIYARSCRMDVYERERVVVLSINSDSPGKLSKMEY
jgi:hypothetical protein